MIKKNILGVQFHPEKSNNQNLTNTERLCAIMKKFELSTFDKQYDELEKEVKFCSNCVVSNQRPRTKLNDEGVCAPCVWSFEKDFLINWEDREKELIELLDRHRSKDGNFDVVVQVVEVKIVFT